MTRLKVNGADAEVAASNLVELLAARGIDPGVRFLAIALNGAVVRRSDWRSTPLSPGDEVEIVRPIHGG